MASHGLDGGHVYGVYIGSFFTVHLNAYEVLIHKFGDTFVFKRFVFHNVAPVTGGISNTQQDGDITGFGFFKSLFSPGKPINGVVFVLQEIRARFF